MAYDLVIRNGTVIDGSGLPRFRADIGISDGRIAEIGKLNGAAADEVIDAEGHVVAPGFIDGHTHMDAQVFWDPLGTCSCWHGVTSVLMGNCGFTLAPCKAEDRRLVLRNLERAEDISPRRWRRASPTGRGPISRNTSTRSKRSPRASTTAPISAIRRCAPTPWASAPSRRRPMPTTWPP